MYLFKMFEFNQEVQPSLNLVCNNEALVDTINQLLNQARPDKFPNDTIKPDWDVLQQIRAIHKQVPTVLLLTSQLHSSTVLVN